MLWLLFLILTILSWGIYDLFFKNVEKQMNYFLALLVIGIFQVLIAMPFVLNYYFNNQLNYTLKGYIMSGIMGILLGLGTVFFFYTFKHGANASVAIPGYTIGVLILGALGGILIFKEAFTLKIAVGLILGIVSMVLLTIK